MFRLLPSHEEVLARKFWEICNEMRLYHSNNKVDSVIKLYLENLEKQGNLKLLKAIKEQKEVLSNA